jgi:hypothetical protein
VVLWYVQTWGRGWPQACADLRERAWRASCVWGQGLRNRGIINLAVEDALELPAVGLLFLPQFLYILVRAILTLVFGKGEAVAHQPQGGLVAITAEEWTTLPHGRSPAYSS